MKKMIAYYRRPSYDAQIAVEIEKLCPAVIHRRSRRLTPRKRSLAAQAEAATDIGRGVGRKFTVTL
jgi:hypothetical protein